MSMLTMRTSRARSIAPHAVMFIILMNIGAVAAFRWPSASDRREAGLQSQNAFGVPDATPRAAGCEPNTALPVVRQSRRAPAATQYRAVWRWSVGAEILRRGFAPPLTVLFILLLTAGF